MKKLLLLLCLTLLLPSFAGAETKTYQFESGNKNGITDDQKGEWTNGTPGFNFSSNNFPANYGGSGTTDRGLSTSITGSVTSNTEFNNVTKIVVDASSNATGNSLKVEIGGTQIGETYSLTKANHKKIEFVSSTPLSGAITFSVTRSNKTVWIAGFELTTAETNPDLQTAELAFEQEAYEFTLGESFVSPQLVKQVTDGAITYKSSNIAVATVNAETGELTLHSAGTTKITATSAATATYNTGTATYTLTVTEKAKLGAITVNGSVPTTDVPVEVYAEFPFVIAAENAESMSVTVMDESAEIIVNEENLATSSYTWTPAAVGSYEVEVSATGCGSTAKVSFTVNVTEQPEISTTTITAANLGIQGAGYRDRIVEIDGITFAGCIGGAYPNGVTQSGDAYYVSIRNSNKDGDFGGIAVTVNEDKVCTGVKITQNPNQNTERKAFVYGSYEAYETGRGINTDNIPAGSVKIGEATMQQGKSVAIPFADEALYYPYIIIISNGALQMSQIDIEWAKRFEMPLIDIDHQGKLSEGGSVIFTMTHSKGSNARIFYIHEPEPQPAAVALKRVPSLSGNNWTELSFDNNTVKISEKGMFNAYASDSTGKNRSIVNVAKVEDDKTTGIAEISAESGETEVFDLQGRRVAKPAKGGVYILKQGSKVSKRIL